MLSDLRGVGFRPQEAKEIVKSLQIGDELQLERDPENPYDPNAIRVIAKGEFIGFVAKEVAAEIAPDMDEGIEYSCIVESRTGTIALMLEILPPEEEENIE